MKNFFNERDFSDCFRWNDQYGSPLEAVTDVANKKLNSFIESQQTVYTGESYNKRWIDCETMHTTRKAKIMFIEEIAKKPCKHNPAKDRLRKDLVSDLVTTKCLECGVELVAEWTAR